MLRHPFIIPSVASLAPVRAAVVLLVAVILVACATPPSLQPAPPPPRGNAVADEGIKAEEIRAEEIKDEGIKAEEIKAEPRRPLTAPADAAVAPRPAVNARILDSVLNRVRPLKLHPTRHMRRAYCPAGHHFRSAAVYDGVAAEIRQMNGVALPDLEVLPGNDGSGFPETASPTGHESEEQFKQQVGHQLWAVEQYRKRLGPEWPIGAYALMPALQGSYWSAFEKGRTGDPATLGWREWQKGNDRIAAVVGDRVDLVCPQLYHFNDDLQQWDWLLKGTVEEGARLAKGRPVYLFVMPVYFAVDKNPQGNQPVKYETFRHWLTTALKATDGREGRPSGGVVVYQGVPGPLDLKADWVRALRDVCDELDAADKATTQPATRPVAG